MRDHALLLGLPAFQCCIYTQAEKLIKSNVMIGKDRKLRTVCMSTSGKGKW